MVTIPYQPTPEVMPQAPPQPSVNANMFGAGVGQALSQIANQGFALADVLNARQRQRQGMEDDIGVQTANNLISEGSYRIHQEMDNEEAAGAPDYVQRLQEARRRNKEAVIANMTAEGYRLSPAALHKIDENFLRGDLDFQIQGIAQEDRLRQNRATKTTTDNINTYTKQFIENGDFEAANANVDIALETMRKVLTPDNMVKYEAESDRLMGNAVIERLAKVQGDMLGLTDPAERTVVKEQGAALVDEAIKRGYIEPATGETLKRTWAEDFDVRSHLTKPPAEQIADHSARSANTRDVIAEAEGTSGPDGYNEVLGYGRYGRPSIPLTEMTLAQVYSFGQNVIRPAHRADQGGKGSSALGRYQIVGTTLKEYAAKLGLDWNTTKFTPEIQDRLADAIIQGQGLTAWEGLNNNPELMARARAGLASTKIPGYENIPLDKMGEMQDSALAELARQVSETNAALARQQVNNAEQLRLGVETGTISRPSEIDDRMRMGDIDAGQAAQLHSRLNEVQQTSVLERQMMADYQSGSPIRDQSQANTIFENTTRGMSGEALSAQENDFIQRNNGRWIPTDTVAALKKGVHSTDAKARASTLERAAQINAMAGDTLAAMENGPTIRSAVSDFNTLKSGRNMTSEEAAAHMIMTESEEYTTDAKVLETRTNNYIEKLELDEDALAKIAIEANASKQRLGRADVMGQEIDDAKFSYPGEADKSTADWKEWFKEEMIRTKGDTELSAANTNQRWLEKWNISMATGQPRIMAWPPEQVYKLDSETLKKEVGRDLMLIPGLGKTENVELLSFALPNGKGTVSEMQAGKPVPYLFVYDRVDENGQIRRETSPNTFALTKEDLIRIETDRKAAEAAAAEEAASPPMRRTRTGEVPLTEEEIRAGEERTVAKERAAAEVISGHEASLMERLREEEEARPRTSGSEYERRETYTGGPGRPPQPRPGVPELGTRMGKGEFTPTLPEDQEIRIGRYRSGKAVVGEVPVATGQLPEPRADVRESFAVRADERPPGSVGFPRMRESGDVDLSKAEKLEAVELGASRPTAGTAPGEPFGLEPSPTQELYGRGRPSEVRAETPERTSSLAPQELTVDRAMAMATGKSPIEAVRPGITPVGVIKAESKALAALPAGSEVPDRLIPTSAAGDKAYVDESEPMEIAKAYLGQNENDNTATLAAFMREAGGKNFVDPIVTPWCATFMNAVFMAGGVDAPGGVSVGSFLNFGTRVDKPERGDIVIMRSKDPRYRHVGFYMGENAMYGERSIRILGGNQNHEVSVMHADPRRVIQFRRPPKAATEIARAGQ